MYAFKDKLLGNMNLITYNYWDVILPLNCGIDNNSTLVAVFLCTLPTPAPN